MYCPIGEKTDKFYKLRIQCHEYIIVVLFFQSTIILTTMYTYLRRDVVSALYVLRVALSKYRQMIRYYETKYQ